MINSPLSELISYKNAGGDVASLLLYNVDAVVEALSVGSIYTF